MKKIIIGVALCLLYSNAVAATFTKNLSVGSSGDEVKKLQQFLVNYGFLNSTTTGYFGAQTKQAVVTFQKQNNIPANGNWYTLTRQKAETTLTKKPVTSTFTIVNSTTSNQSSNTKYPVIVDVNTGGQIFSDQVGSCYSGEICKKTVTSQKILLKAVPYPGYLLDNWSEAGCFGKTECAVTLQGTTTVYVRFKVASQEKPFAKFSSSHPTDTCYIALGRQTCDWRMTWDSNLGLNLHVRVDDDEYYLALKDPNPSYKTADTDPADVQKATDNKTNGPIYFSLGMASRHKAELLNNGDVLDSVVIDVKCAAGTEWDGDKCWTKNARRLFVFKQDGVLITSSPSGIKCGYEPELCFTGFLDGTTVTLTASSTGHQFLGWQGDCTASGNTCTVIMNGTKSVGLKF